VLSTLAVPVRARILIDLPPDWVLVSSGEVSRNADRWLLVNTIPQLDIAWAASPSLRTHGDPALRVFHRGLEQDVLAKLVDRTGACRDHLDRRFPEAGSLPELRILVAGRAESGYARKNYVVLSHVGDRSEPDLTEFVCHELAHFWSTGAPPLSVDNWMNEGFAVLISADAVEKLHSSESFAKLLDAWRLRSENAGSIWTADDQSRRSHAVNYAKAPLFLTRLRKCMGRDEFESLLVRYATEPINSTEHLLDAIEDLSGRSLKNWTVRQLSLEAREFMDAASCPGR
jgi:hypothetical protein